MKKVTLYLFSSLLCLCCLSFAHLIFANNENENPLRQLRFPKGYNFKTYERKEYGAFTTTYEVKLTYPSKEIVEYYDRELKKMGWAPYADPSYAESYRKWDCFEDGTTHGSPLVHQLIAKWTDAKKSRMIMIGIRYYSYDKKRKEVCCDDGPSNDIQYVNVQIMPFVALPNPGMPPPRSTPN
jgi:hypothetical protein